MPRLKLNVILDADFGDQVELGFDEINVILFRFQDLAKEVASDEVTHDFTTGDAFAQNGQRVLFELKITFENLLHALAYQQLVEILQIGQSVKKEDALDQLVCVLHFID